MFSGGLTYRHGGKVDLGSGDFVDVVGQRIERDVQHDLDDLRVVEARAPDRGDIGVRDVAALTHNRHGEANGGVGFRIVRRTVAIGGDFGIVQTGHLLAEEGKSALLHKVALLLSVLGATAIFGFGKTSGLVIGSLVMFALTLIQSYDLRLLAPTLGLALYRLAKGTITDQGGYELANHYLLSGIIGGAILVLVFDEWQNRERSGWSGVGWLLVLPSMGAMIQFALDFRGLVGWLLGSALGIALLPGRKSLAFTALPISAGLLLLIPRLLNDTTTLSRTERMLEGMWWCVPVVLGVAVLMIPKGKKEVVA